MKSSIIAIAAAIILTTPAYADKMPIKLKNMDGTQTQ